MALVVAEYKHLANCELRADSPWTLAQIERAYRRAIKLDRTYGRAWEGLAAVLDQREKYPEAARAARAAIRYYGHPDSIAILARVLAQQGKRTESRRWANHPKVRRSKRSLHAKSVARDVLNGLWDPDLFVQSGPRRRTRARANTQPR